jgi:hypothetical protein
VATFEKRGEFWKVNTRRVRSPARTRTFECETPQSLPRPAPRMKTSGRETLWTASRRPPPIFSAGLLGLELTVYSAK